MGGFVWVSRWMVVYGWVGELVDGCVWVSRLVGGWLCMGG